MGAKCAGNNKVWVLDVKTGETHPHAFLNRLLLTERKRSRAYPKELCLLSPNREWILFQMGINSRVAGRPMLYYWATKLNGSQSVRYPARENVNGRTEHTDYKALWRRDSKGWADYWFDPADSGIAAPGHAVHRSLSSRQPSKSRPITLTGIPGWTRGVKYDPDSSFVGYADGFYNAETQRIPRLTFIPLVKGSARVRLIEIPEEHISWMASASPKGKRFFWTLMKKEVDRSGNHKVSCWLSDSHGSHFQLISTGESNPSGNLSSALSNIQWTPDEKSISFVVDGKLHLLNLSTR